MTGNPKSSKWRSTLQASRKRKQVCLTLSDKARGALHALADALDDRTCSSVVESLLLTEYERKYGRSLE